MNTVETLQAAIARLERIRSAGGGWYVTTHPEYPSVEVAYIRDAVDGEVATFYTDGSAERAADVVTLRRTVDVQLELLHLAIRFDGIGSNVYTGAALNLANAILGGRS